MRLPTRRLASISRERKFPCGPPAIARESPIDSAVGRRLLFSPERCRCGPWRPVFLQHHPESTMSRIFVLHENPAWLGPFTDAFDRLGLPWSEWFLHEGTFDLSAPPPQGVFYNRISASSHTRDHRFSAELTSGVLAWLVRHGRRVVNGPGALDLEISKARQYAGLEAAGIAVPRTVLVAGVGQLASAAGAHFPASRFILKPNRGGKGLGVRLFESPDALQAYLDSAEYEPPVDGLHLLQEYVR